MPSKLLSAAHQLLETQTESENQITVKDKACHAWLRDTPLKALHPSRQVLYGHACQVSIYKLLSFWFTCSRMLLQPNHLLGGA